MAAPRIPGHTCPQIDKVKEIIESALRIADSATGSDDLETLQQAVREIRWTLNGEADRLEPIRAANLALREAAEYWQEEAETLSEAQE